jgi:hypothetical protein
MKPVTNILLFKPRRKGGQKIFAAINAMESPASDQGHLVEVGWLSGRPRWQASSHIDWGIRKRMDGFQAAIASRAGSYQKLKLHQPQHESHHAAKTPDHNRSTAHADHN